MPFGVVVRDTERACVVVSSKDLAVLGGVLVWIDREKLSDVQLVAEHHASIHARRALRLAPEITMWELSADRVARAAPEPLAELAPAPVAVSEIVALIEKSGADAVVEDGIVRAEVAGLEVGRVVDSPEGPRLEVGVGRFDREAAALLHGGRHADQALADVITQVSEHRQGGAVSHAVNRIGRERWLRTMVRDDPGLAGVEAPTEIDPVPPRSSLLDSGPAALIGTRNGGRALVACSVGVDLGLVPELSDLAERHEVDEICVVLPARDHFGFLDVLLARLASSTEIISIDPPWVD